MPRIALVTDRDQVPEAQRDAWDEIARSRGRVVGPFGVLMHSPELARRVAHLGAYVRFDSMLDMAVREFVVVVAARLFGCAYEWAAHVPHARAAGVAESSLLAVETGRFDDLPEDERLIAGAVRELVDRRALSPDTLATIQARFGIPGAVELVGTVGYYGLLALELNTFDVQPGAKEVTA